jgi:hypothetical protein
MQRRINRYLRDSERNGHIKGVGGASLVMMA